jgi:putative flippase GtrA
MPREFIRFCLVGLSNTALTLGTYAVLLESGVWYLAASVIGVAVGMVNGYTWNRLWTFGVGRHRHAMAVRYVTVSLTGMAISAALLVLFVEQAGLGEFIAQVLALPFVVAVTFTANRQWTFAVP